MDRRLRVSPKEPPRQKPVCGIWDPGKAVGEVQEGHGFLCLTHRKGQQRECENRLLRACIGARKSFSPQAPSLVEELGGMEDLVAEPCVRTVRGASSSGWWPGLELGLDGQRLFLHKVLAILLASTFREENICKTGMGGWFGGGTGLWTLNGLG